MTELAKEGNAVSKSHLKTIGAKVDCEQLSVREACTSGNHIVSIMLLENLVNDFIQQTHQDVCFNYIPDVEQQWGLANKLRND